MPWMPIKNPNSRRIYSVKSGSPVPQDRAQEVGEYIEALEEEGMEITPPNLVDEAKSASSKLHDLFEWDDGKAAYSHRLATARQIVNHFEIEVFNPDTEDEMVTKAWHSVEVTTKAVEVQRGEKVEVEVTTRRYINHEAVMSDEDKRRQVLENAMNEARRWQDRYKTYKELAKISEAIDATGEDLAA